MDISNGVDRDNVLLSSQGVMVVEIGVVWYL